MGAFAKSLESPVSRRRQLTVDDYVVGVRAGDRAILGRAITLVESQAAKHQALAADVLTAVMPFTGGALRVGVTGVPGVGKSTFIDQLGTNLTAAGRRVAVLAVDPSSSRSGGSILGDKTRMARLAVDPCAFIRPSPASGTLGGVASKTRETMLLCEAAGYDVVLVETVGVGQSETVVAGMTDFFLVLMLAGAGDELQGIKRGLMELADLLAVNKADGDNALNARMAAARYRTAVTLLHAKGGAWRPPVVTCSGLANEGLEAVWEKVEERCEQLSSSGELIQRRREQALGWMWALVDERLAAMLRADEAVREVLPLIEKAVRDGELAPTTGARRMLVAFSRGSGPRDALL